MTSHASCACVCFLNLKIEFNLLCMDVCSAMNWRKYFLPATGIDGELHRVHAVTSQVVVFIYSYLFSCFGRFMWWITCDTQQTSDTCVWWCIDRLQHWIKLHFKCMQIILIHEMRILVNANKSTKNRWRKSKQRYSISPIHTTDEILQGKNMGFQQNYLWWCASFVNLMMRIQLWLTTDTQIVWSVIIIFTKLTSIQTVNAMRNARIRKLEIENIGSN